MLLESVCFALLRFSLQATRCRHHLPLSSMSIGPAHSEPVPRFLFGGESDESNSDALKPDITSAWNPEWFGRVSRSATRSRSVARHPRRTNRVSVATEATLLCAADGPLSRGQSTKALTPAKILLRGSRELKPSSTRSAASQTETVFWSSRSQESVQTDQSRDVVANLRFALAEYSSDLYSAHIRKCAESLFGSSRPPCAPTEPATETSLSSLL